MTKEEAIILYKSKFWDSMSWRDRAMFQMFANRLCMPFDVFHEAIEKTLGRPVFNHEFGMNKNGLQKELLGDAPIPSFKEREDLECIEIIQQQRYSIDTVIRDLILIKSEYGDIEVAGQIKLSLKKGILLEAKIILKSEKEY